MGWNIHQTERRDQLLLMEISLYIATHMLKGLSLLSLQSAMGVMGLGRGYEVRPSSSGENGSYSHSKGMSDGELGRLGSCSRLVL